MPKPVDSRTSHAEHSCHRGASFRQESLVPDSHRQWTVLRCRLCKTCFADVFPFGDVKAIISYLLVSSSEALVSSRLVLACSEPFGIDLSEVCSEHFRGILESRFRNHLCFKLGWFVLSATDAEGCLSEWRKQVFYTKLRAGALEIPHPEVEAKAEILIELTCCAGACRIPTSQF